MKKYLSQKLKISCLFIIIIWTTNIFADFTKKNSVSDNIPHQTNIVVTIKPLYNLTMALLQGINNVKATLLLHGNISPHDYALKLSDTKRLVQADLVIWCGEDLEVFLIKLLKQKPKIQLFTTQNLNKLDKLKARNSHDTHSHYLDEHVWLSPYNVKIIIKELTQTLIKIDPKNKNKYLENKQKFLNKLANADLKIKNKLNKIKTQPYLVFHDAYQYFEKYYGLNEPILISDDPSIPLSIQRMLFIHDLIINKQVKCLFKEPQFNSKMLDSLIDGVSNEPLKVGVLDPIGSDQDLGANGYFKLLNNLAEGFYGCFK